MSRDASPELYQLPRRSRLWRLQRNGAPYLFLAPFLILFFCFILYPLMNSIALSFEKTAGPRLTRFAGLAHFRFLLHDWLFWVAMANTIGFAIAFLCVQIPASLGLAMLLNHPRVRFRNVLRFAFFSSNLVGQAFAAVLFTLLLAPREGLLDRVLGFFCPRLAEIDWKSDWRFARLAILIAALWLSIGYAMIYFLAALQAVDRDLYEAALTDGAGRWPRFWHVTLPQIRPVLVFVILVGTIGSLSLFELPYVFFQGSGPGFAGLTVVAYLFTQGFGAGDLGYASAIAWALVILIGGIALIQIRVTRIGREQA
jgi:ABC-type sugar transport system permease subunit